MSKETSRSVDAMVYQDLPQAIGAMSKIFADGHVIPLHHHQRDQLLYAIRGIMRLRTAKGAWIVPPNGAIYIPAGTAHSVTMHGDVDMRTLYIDAKKSFQRQNSLFVFSVSGLLRELILALSAEPVVFAVGSRGALLAQMIEHELGRVEELALSVPLPRDERLQRLCAQLLANPADRRTLDKWAEISGASTRTLSRLFESDLGMSFGQWRVRIRIHSAIEALFRGDRVSQVAAQHGYRSASAFSFAFNKVMGIPPSKIVPKERLL